MTHLRAWCFGLLCLSSATALAQGDLPDPSQTYIAAFSYNGQGCRAGTAVSNLSPDRQALTLLFSEFQVTGGLRSPSRQQRAEIACRLNMTMHVPAGYSFSILTVDTQGFANLEEQTLGYQRTRFAWANSPAGLQRLSQVDFRGPYFDNFISSTSVSSASLTWSPCTGSNQPLSLEVAIGVDGRMGLMAIDSLDATVQQKYRLAWRRCADQGAGFPVARLNTQGAVARDTSLCLNFRSGQMTVSSSAPNLPGQAYARLQHVAAAVTGQMKQVSKDSYDTGRMDIYALPGDWNSITSVRPEVNLSPAAAGARPSFAVSQTDAQTKCVRVTGGPANVAIRWNPQQP